MNRQTYKEMTHDFRADTRNVASANPTLGAVGRTWLHKQLGLDKTLMPLVPPSYMWSFWMDRAATERKRLQEVVSTVKNTNNLPLSTQGLTRYADQIQCALQNARASWTLRLP